MIQAGFFECDITPPLGADRPCAFSRTLIKKISDPLKIRALALSDGTTKVAVIGSDNLGCGPVFLRKLKEALPEVFMTAVKCIHSERDGTFVLVYRPAELSRPLKERLSAVEERCSGELKLPLGQLIKSL